LEERFLGHSLLNLPRKGTIMRKNKIEKPQEIIQYQYSNKSSSQRNSEVGLNLKPIGQATNAAAKRLVRDEKFVPVVVFNAHASAVCYVKFGNKDVTAPTGPADGFPILPGEKVTLNSGENTYLRASNASGVYLYIAPEEE
jgi:hypothetical protein